MENVSGKILQCALCEMIGPENKRNTQEFSFRQTQQYDFSAVYETGIRKWVRLNVTRCKC